MDCYSTYPDYRHPSASGGGYYGYNQIGNARHPSQYMSMYRGSGPPPTMYNDYGRYGYQSSAYNYNSTPGHGYYRENYDFTQPNGIRDNSYYGYHPYDNFRYSYHHKESYSSDGMYGGHNGYQYPYPREHPYHLTHPSRHILPSQPLPPHHMTTSKEIYQPPSNLNDIEIGHQQNNAGSPLTDYSPVHYPSGTNGMSPALSHSTGSFFMHQ